MEHKNKLSDVEERDQTFAITFNDGVDEDGDDGIEVTCFVNGKVTEMANALFLLMTKRQDVVHLVLSAAQQYWSHISRKSFDTEN